MDTTTYDKLIAASNKFFANDIVGCADVLYEIDSSLLTSQSMSDMYNALKNLSFETAGSTYNNLAYQSFNTGAYDVAIPYFEKAVVFSPQNVDLMYNLGKCYKAQNNGQNNEKSIECFNKVIEMAPGSDHAKWAESQKK